MFLPMFLTPPSPDVVHECSSYRCWYETIFTLIERFYHIFIIMNLSDSNFCAKKLRQTRGAAPHRFLSRIDTYLCRSMERCICACSAYCMRVAGSIHRPCTGNKTTPRIPQNAPQSVLKFQNFPGGAYPQTPLYVSRVYLHQCM